MVEGSEARRVLDRELDRAGLDPAALRGHGTQATGHLQVASATAAGLAGAGVASEPAALADGGSLPGYDPGRCGEHVATLAGRLG